MLNRREFVALPGLGASTGMAALELGWKSRPLQVPTSQLLGSSAAFLLASLGMIEYSVGRFSCVEAQLIP